MHRYERVKNWLYVCPACFKKREIKTAEYQTNGEVYFCVR